MSTKKWRWVVEYRDMPISADNGYHVTYMWFTGEEDYFQAYNPKYCRLVQPILETEKEFDGQQESK